MEREMGADKIDNRMAPCINKRQTRSCSFNSNLNHTKFPVFNGKQLKVSVLKLNGIRTDKKPLLSGKSRSAEKSPRKRKFSQKTLSNNNTINGETEIAGKTCFSKSMFTESVSSVPASSNFVFDNSLSNCGSCADSPQSIISEDTSSQASDSIINIAKNDFLQHSNSESSSLESISSAKVEDASVSQNNGKCKWDKCSDTQVNHSQLQDHINKHHIQPQTSNGSYVCLWVGCKVYNKPASNRAWLERHVLHHSGGKPFNCIIDGCDERFSSRLWLERHVRAHLDGSSGLSGKNGRDSHGGTPTKNSRKRKLKRRIIRPIKTEDYFDAFVMENIKLSNQKYPKDEATFRSTVIATRQEPNGTKSVLLQWTPASVLPDEWIPEDQVQQVISIPLKALPHHSTTQVSSQIYRKHRYRKHRRK